MATTNAIRERYEIPVEDKWAVEDLFPSDEAWAEELATIPADREVLAGFAGKLGESAQQLYTYLDLMEKISVKGSLLANYAMRKSDEDTRVAKEKHFKSSTTTTNTVTTADTEITILSHTFVLDRHVKKMFKSQTEYNNANTFIMLLYENNKIYLIDRRTFSPRRPFTKDVKGKETFDATINSIYVDPELKGYKPIVLVDSKAVLDAKRELTEVNDVVVAPTQSESTFMVCSIGNDVACYKVFPDKIYDSYNKGTQAVIIVIFTIVFGVCIWFVRRYVKRKEFKNVFLNDTI